MRHSGARRVLDVATASILGAALLAPAVDMALRPATARDSHLENREPSPLPSAPRSLADATAWSQSFDSWFSDTFGLRDRLLGARNSALLELELSPTSLLDVGPSGWIYWRGDAEYEAHRGTFTLGQRELDAWVDALEERRVRLAARGARFVFAIAPDKEEIYPEFLPEKWRPVGPSMGDLFLEAIQRRTQVEVVDLRPALRAAKAFDRPEVEDYVYFPRGTHWTSRGACAATTVLLERLRTWYPTIAALDCGALEIEMLPPDGEDSWVRYLYTPWRLRPYHYVTPKDGWGIDLGSTPVGPLESGLAIGRDASAPSMLMLHDSYGPFLHPFLGQRTSRLRSSWQSWVPEQIVDVEHPDVVLMIKAERMLSQPPEADAHSVLEASNASTGTSSPLWSLVDDLDLARVVGAAKLERAPDGGVTWRPTERTDHFVVEASRAETGVDSLVVSYEIDAPVAGNLEIWPSEKGKQGWPGKRSVRVPLEPGRNHGDVVLPVVDFGGRTLVRIGPVASWRVRKLALQTSNWSRAGVDDAARR